MNKFLIRSAVAGTVLFGAIFAAVVMVLLAPDAERADPEVHATPVRVVVVHARTENSLVEGNGTVQAAERIALVPQVSGRITWVSDQLVPGGRFDKGQVIARIDDRDYVLAVRQEASRVRQAELELQLEHGRQQVAVREWEMLSDGRPVEEAPLALRKPHLATVEQALEAAQSGLARAELALERTRLVAPFNAMVIDESLDVGQVVGGAAVATLVGSDRFWVTVSIPVESMRWLMLGERMQEAGAHITQPIGNGEGVIRQGRVLQLGGQLDPQTRMATVIVGIDHPLNAPDGALPMLPGAYVEVVIEGKPVEQVFEVPRVSIRDGNSVLVVAEGERLGNKPVDVLWGSGQYVWVSGLAEGDRVLTSAMAVPIDGMTLLVLDDDGTARNEATTDDGAAL
jgi:RND family efflux transporter MFP subunit